MLRNWLGNISERRLSNSVCSSLTEALDVCWVSCVCVREWASNYNSQWMFFHWTDAVLSFSWFSMSWKCWTFRSFPILYVIHYIIYVACIHIVYGMIRIWFGNMLSLFLPPLSPRRSIVPLRLFLLSWWSLGYIHCVDLCWSPSLVLSIFGIINETNEHTSSNKLYILCILYIRRVNERGREKNGAMCIWWAGIFIYNFVYIILNRRIFIHRRHTHQIKCTYRQ